MCPRRKQYRLAHTPGGAESAQRSPQRKLMLAHPIVLSYIHTVTCVYLSREHTGGACASAALAYPTLPMLSLLVCMYERVHRPTHSTIRVPLVSAGRQDSSNPAMTAADLLVSACPGFARLELPGLVACSPPTAAGGAWLCSAAS